MSIETNSELEPPTIAPAVLALPERAGPAKPVPVARPARKRLGLQVETLPEFDEPEAVLTPEVIQGWAWSIGLHSLLLIILASWYLVEKKNSTVTIETRLAGSLNGLEGGLTNTGGLDTLLSPMEGAFATPLQPTLTNSSTNVVLDPKLSGLSGAPNPNAGGGADRGNPGAGDGNGFGIARFGNGGETIGGVQVKVGDPQFTLLWDTEADIDLHVIEPGGAEIFWEVRHGKRGGELDVDDVDGFGPENIYWLTDGPTKESEKVKGRGPLGEYQWFVLYYGGLGGIPKSTNWRVRIKHDGKEEIYRGVLKSIGQRSKTFNLKVDDRSRNRDSFLDGVFDGIKKREK